MASLPKVTSSIVAAVFAATTAPAQTGAADAGTGKPTRAARPSCCFVGVSVTNGLAWRNLAWHSPDPSPVMFAEKILNRTIEKREYALRTDSLRIRRLVERLAGKRIRLEDRSRQLLLNPLPMLEAQLERAFREKHRLVVGLDFMAFFGFGPVDRAKRGATKAEKAAHQASQRYERQQKGFDLVDEMLEGNRTVFVLGDYPDLTDSNQILLKPYLRPTGPVLAELNRRLHAFAAKRERVVVFPMHDILNQARQGRLEVTIAGETRKLRTADVLQFDEIHPNRVGVAILLCKLVERVAAEAPQVRDCLPELPDFATLLGKAGLTVADLDYLAGRGAR